MCTHTTFLFTSTRCELAKEKRHRYKEIRYELCKDSVGLTPCANTRPEEGQADVFRGKRTDPCPVCRQLREAKEAYQQAKKEYQQTVKAAGSFVTGRWQKNGETFHSDNSVHYQPYMGLPASATPEPASSAAALEMSDAYICPSYYICGKNRKHSCLCTIVQTEDADHVCDESCERVIPFYTEACGHDHTHHWPCELPEVKTLTAS
ncbi:hypothetical protein PVAG01_04505 [Phlyctema vagabunda]|uniref:Uncharacterized protein n=1 Tax=Phlyctema vagabunda TaxID=108571 RepID=A0ABR4PPI8_9HELO